MGFVARNFRSSLGPCIWLARPEVPPLFAHKTKTDVRLVSALCFFHIPLACCLIASHTLPLPIFAHLQSIHLIDCFGLSRAFNSTLSAPDRGPPQHRKTSGCCTALGLLPLPRPRFFLGTLLSLLTHTQTSHSTIHRKQSPPYPYQHPPAPSPSERRSLTIATRRARHPRYTRP